MLTSPLTFPLLARPPLGAALVHGRSLPAPRALLTWWLAIALLTWVQLRHGELPPLPGGSWHGVVALALSITIVSSVATKSALEGLLLLVCAGAVALDGGSGAILPLASVGAALAISQTQDSLSGRRLRPRWHAALAPCLVALLGLAAWGPALVPARMPADAAAQAMATAFLAALLGLSWIHSRHCQGAGGAAHAGAVCAVATATATAGGLQSGDPALTVTMLLTLAMWLPLLLAAHLPAGNPVSWWFRRGAVCVSACALVCWIWAGSLPV
ncbi:MAG TPA: hypothetical protein PK359_10775 [Burkholderiaceae bacterium]|nr:hypothetical protein [Burkholderiaceae bacterium]